MARRQVPDKKPGKPHVHSDTSNRSIKPDVSTNVIKREPTPPPPPPRIALSIPEFCVAFGISEDFFYKLKRQGQAPRLMKIGGRTLVSLQAANEWLVERERDAIAKVEARA
jgi:predicted DNA-binding transcriptional regulator AlpA